MNANIYKEWKYTFLSEVWTTSLLSEEAKWRSYKQKSTMRKSATLSCLAWLFALSLLKSGCLTSLEDSGDFWEQSIDNEQLCEVAGCAALGMLVYTSLSWMKVKTRPHCRFKYPLYYVSKCLKGLKRFNLKKDLLANKTHDSIEQSMIRLDYQKMQQILILWTELVS